MQLLSVAPPHSLVSYSWLCASLCQFNESKLLALGFWPSLRLSILLQVHVLVEVNTVSGHLMLVRLADFVVLSRVPNASCFRFEFSENGDFDLTADSKTEEYLLCNFSLGIPSNNLLNLVSPVDDLLYLIVSQGRLFEVVPFFSREDCFGLLSFLTSSKLLRL